VRIKERGGQAMPGDKVDPKKFFETLARIIGDREGVEIRVVEIVEVEKRPEEQLLQVKSKAAEVEVSTK
jgi:hypothetical protein